MDIHEGYIRNPEIMWTRINSHHSHCYRKDISMPHLSGSSLNCLINK